MDEDLLDEEARQLQLAIQNSRQDTQNHYTPVAEGPTYRPTIEEFRDPLGYISRFEFEIFLADLRQHSRRG